MRAVMQGRMVDQTNSICNEVEQYFSDKYVGLHVEEFDIAAWWRQNVNTYPVLAKLAKDVLAIPCATVALENAFSLRSRVVDPFRAPLAPNMVEALVYTSDWLKGEDVNLYKEPTEEELEFYTTIEEMEKEDDIVQSMERPLASVSTLNSATMK